MTQENPIPSPGVYIPERRRGIHSPEFAQQRITLRQRVLDNASPSVTMAGSFRFKPLMDQIRNQFEEDGFQVLAPPRGNVVGQIDNFPMLEGDNPTDDPLDLEDQFLMAGMASDLIYIVNPDGYMGDLSSFETGVFGAWGVPIYSYQPINPDLDPGHPTWWAMCEVTIPYDPKDLMDRVKDGTIFHELSLFKPWNPVIGIDRVEWDWFLDHAEYFDQLSPEDQSRVLVTVERQRESEEWARQMWEKKSRSV